MPSGFEQRYHIYCYSFRNIFWIGWIYSMKWPLPKRYFNDEPYQVFCPESWLDYVTFGFTREAVMKKLRKRYEKLKDIH
jgi:hypothetical protein